MEFNLVFEAERFDFDKLPSDTCVLILFEEGSSARLKMIAIAYMDHSIVAGGLDDVQILRKDLNVVFPTKNLGEWSQYNSCSFSRD